MARTALLIGSDYGGLRGIAQDLASMEAALGEHRFTPRIYGPDKASRDGILAAYDELIADAGPGDAVVVYYSGHGGFTAPAGAAATGPTELQYIVPTDYGYSTENDFRGIASAELSVLQARLTAKTPNVTVFLDCCHSGLMCRDAGLTLKAVAPTSYERVSAHLDRLVRDGLRTDLISPDGNPHAVRLVACTPQQRAYEYRGEEGEHTGIFTESLVGALTEASFEPVTWADILDRVRQRVIGLRVDQRPEVEGPADRLLFSTEVAELLHSLPVTGLDRPGRVRLDCAPLLRVQDGDEFAIMPPGSTGLEPGNRIGDLTIDSMSALSASGTVILVNGHSEIPLGSRAFRTKAAAPRIAVKVPTGHPAAGRVRAALTKAALARPAEPDEGDWTGEVRIEPDGGITLCDRVGPLHPPYRQDAQGFDDLARAVKILAQGTELRRLVGDSSFPLDAAVTIEWGEVEDGVARPLALKGAVLPPGQKVYVKVCNGGNTPVYVSLVDIGLSGRISLVYRHAPGGRLLPPGRELTLGYNEITHVLKGNPLSWPTNLDPCHARPETILVVLTSEPQNLLALEVPEIVQTRSAKDLNNASRLEIMIDQLASGGTRELAPDLATDVRYDIRAIDFEMTPALAISHAQEGIQSR